jgi:hypothetical protein
VATRDDVRRIALALPETSEAEGHFALRSDGEAFDEH